MNIFILLRKACLAFLFFCLGCDENPAFLGGHQIYIYVNDKNEFVRAEVKKVYNAL